MRNNEKKRFFSVFIVSFFLLSFLAITGLLTSSDAWAAGLKKVVAVSRFDDRTSWTGQWHLDDGKQAAADRGGRSRPANSRCAS